MWLRRTFKMIVDSKNFCATLACLNCAAIRGFRLDKARNTDATGHDHAAIVLQIVQTCIDDFSANTDIKAQPDLTIDESGLDSLSMMELMTELEDAFAIEMPDDSAERVNSVSDLIDLVDQCLATQRH